MAGELKTTIIGNLVGDPELSYTKNGTPVANFRIAQAERVYRDGRWEDGDTIFLPCTVWREQAEEVEDKLRKGDRVIAHGALKQRQYETKTGEKRYTIELLVDDIGPSYRWARKTAPRQESSDPWNAASPAATKSDEPPF
ncbi:single-stranded DNA-binding protein [uncultured Corynebacterium sp.]|uniref:single-stranded DNA-binding protein n=1 Tax=uncultured Corynebacterium sp. TaxID=159447 RepID=UPI002612F30C|nr:single-stranded DNA-binding protein [uncultured Corynebacterium sp.]